MRTAAIGPAWALPRAMEAVMIAVGSVPPAAIVPTDADIDALRACGRGNAEHGRRRQSEKQVFSWRILAVSSRTPGFLVGMRDADATKSPGTVGSGAAAWNEQSSTAWERNQVGNVASQATSRRVLENIGLRQQPCDIGPAIQREWERRASRREAQQAFQARHSSMRPRRPGMRATVRLPPALRNSAIGSGIFGHFAEKCVGRGCSTSVAAQAKPCFISRRSHQERAWRR
jgi:hypothetical protein